MVSPRRRSKKNSYTVKYLLAKQPAPVKKSPRFKELTSLLKGSSALQKLRFNRKSYSILNSVRVDTKLLKEFCHPFFQLFAEIKGDYLKEKAERRRKKAEFIFKEMQQLPPLVKAYLKELRIYEQRFAKRAACWREHFYPNTKKLCRELKGLSHFEWYLLFQKHRTLLLESYPAVDGSYLSRLLSLFLFELSPARYDSDTILGQYRKLALKYHPDSGGSAGQFDLLQSAKNSLVSR